MRSSLRLPLRRLSSRSSRHRSCSTGKTGPGPDLRAKRPQALALGAAAGGMTGWLGWGAAQVLIPGLPGIGVSPLQAGALSLCTLAGITLSSSLKFNAEGCSDWRRALALGVPAVCCAPLGAIAAGRVAGWALQVCFNTLTVVVMPAQAVYFAWKLQQPPATPDPADANLPLGPLPPPPSTLEATRHAVFGAICGFGSGFLGVAGLPFVVRCSRPILNTLLETFNLLLTCSHGCYM